MDTEILSEQCQEVLNGNDHETHTVPAPGLYPHQWLWDSCFAAIGWAQINTERAKQEVYSLINGQWSNGMIPHMIFDMSSKYNGDRNTWRSWVSSYSPDNVSTSGITQPPLLAEAVSKIGAQIENHDKIHFYRKTLPALIKYHQWLYNDRDPHKEGLVLQIHPHETGMDNTPPWMSQLHEHSRPWWIGAIEYLHLNHVVNAIRRDHSKPSGQRIKNIDAIESWDIIRRLRRKHYDIEKILHRSFFVINDVSFNSIFVRGNCLLKQMAEEVHITLPQELQQDMERTEQALESLWDESFNAYFSRDFVTNHLLKEPTIACLMPLYAGTISKERADKLVKILSNDHAFWLKYPVPSVPRNVRYFEPERYWQGPTWVNTNWMLIDGLFRLGYEKEALALKSSTLEMLRENGIWEYYNPLTGEGLGSKNFSWSAALALDLLEE
jgi:hypothetical protein